MTHREVETLSVRAIRVSCTNTTLQVALADGRTLQVPLDWFPRLAAATPEQRAEVEISPTGEGLHWTDLDEDPSVGDLLVGRGLFEGKQC
jgi:hypothetical protein